MTTTPTTLRAALSRPLAALAATGLLATLLAGCAGSDRRSLVGRTYDNVVARDNAYFLAREKMREVEAKLNTERVNDYNRVLPLFPVIDQPTATRLTADMDDIIKKASIPVQYRPGSDWTDDSYLLIGQARYYKGEFEDAAKTFKYVNSTGKDLNARHEALVWLMRTFLALNELDNVAAVSNILDKEAGTERNARALFLTRAEYYQRVNEPLLAIENLEKAIPYIEEKNEQSRTRYVLAQLYQAQGDDKKAYAELNQILKKNPPYELDFYSKLMLGQVSDLNLNDRARLEKYFAKLLKDPNNKEYTDKIYYEMGRFEYRQQRFPAALTLLEKSVRVPKGSPAQKAYTHLLQGRIYYENLQRYRLAAAYYDSTVQAMPKANPAYEAVAERAGILQDFATQLTIVETQDSLQALARLGPDELTTRLTTYAEAELAERQRQADLLAARQAKELERQQAQQQTAVGLAPGRDLQPGINSEDFLASNTGGKWYFDNPTALSTARGDFIRRWGDRPLQDNWRTVTQASSSPVTPQGGSVPVSIAGNSSTAVNGTGLNPGSPTEPAADPQAQLRDLVSQYRQNVPLTPAQLTASDNQTQEALYQLGSIYNQQLREPEKAVETYETQLRRYPQGPHTPETLYILYLIKKESDATQAEQYAARLRQAYPNSSYARLVADPDYLRRTSVANAKVAVLVDSAFAAYKRQDFKKAGTTLDQAKKEYPETDLNDQVAYLGALVSVRTQPPPTARAAVEKFYKDYPQSPLAAKASTLLETYQKYDQGQIAGAMASTTEPGKSEFRPGEIEPRSVRRFRPEPSPQVLLPAPVTPAPTLNGSSKGVPAGATTPASANQPTQPAPTPPAAPTETPVPAEPVPPTPLTPAEEALAARRAAAQARARGRKAPAAPKKTAEPTAPAEPAPVVPATAPATAPATSPVPSPVAPPAATPPPAPAAPVSPYKVDLAAGHSVVIVLAKDAPQLTDMAAQLTAYNSRFYKSSSLQVRRQALNATEEAVIIEGLDNAKLAQSYALKLRGPQSPLSKLRGAGYQTLVVGMDNLPVLLQEGKPAEYQRFYDQNYR
ncbi:type IX secretion system periplasmic lipoprotein PorW/SprE [Hymenobacter lapidiphilus]|uniref:Tetratricopeptide repeat protein n=1 Tax=Hymenobacter lapidiphilus TaxID=2608003 RepID=A0A7Y7U5U8_9BACT|nr:tetratricopeptide repeat protein [Hymenobacter lapidiphilus]NVO30840.1 tetratricopeptide repeat protein [Hymenobacter lapidiphilus]